MTIETIFEVNCDACGASHHDDANQSKADVWSELRESGWKRRKQYTWCPVCVREGYFKANFIDWPEPQGRHGECSIK